MKWDYFIFWFYGVQLDYELNLSRWVWNFVLALQINVLSWLIGL